MRFVPLTPALLRLLPLRDPRSATWMNASYIEAATRPQMGFAALEGGYILGAGGLVSMWHGRAIGWMLPSIFARPRHFLRGAAFARTWLAGMQRDPAFRRIECHVLARFDAGLRFAAAMGFDAETRPLAAWGPDGESYVQFVRVAPNVALAEAAE